MFQATRRRLALWYTLVTALLMILFATGVYLYVRQTLVERIDDTLKHVVEVVNRSLVVQTLPMGQGRINLAASFRQNEATVEDDHIDWEWFSPTGVLLWSTLNELQQLAFSPSPQPETVTFSRDHLLRQVTERIERHQQVIGYLRVSHPWFEVTKPIQQLLWDLTLGLLGLISSAAAIGWFLSGLAIQPIKDSYQSLKQFTADASHELRNPIAVIQTTVQMALNYPDPVQQQQQLKVIERLTQRLGNLVNDLLFLARADSGTVQFTPKPLPLDALLMEVMEEQQLNLDPQTINLSLHIDEPTETLSTEPFMLVGDWDQLARLFTNLISNALRYAVPDTSPAAKTVISVQLRQLVKDRHPYLQVKVQDNGPGIPPSALTHLFDRFYRVDPARSAQYREGTGLGLAIAQVIVQNHQGQISVESSQGQGTTFMVTLPGDVISGS